MKRYGLNDTSRYHRESLSTLGWELTVCNALDDTGSPCRYAITRKTTFGELLYDYLSSVIPLDAVNGLIEIGGGYGYTMRDFMNRGDFSPAAMLDLSPALLERQKQTLDGFTVEFYLRDFFETDAAFFKKFDMVLLIEVAGDFPALCDVVPDDLAQPGEKPDPLLQKAKNILSAYSIPMPDYRFNLNIGAIEAVEKLCAAGIKYIYISEHSCESAVPESLKNKITVSSTGNPERIRLMGHDEYTIKFSHLVQVAERYGYRVLRGRYSDFIQFEYTDRLNYILTSHSQKDEHEIIRHFIEDLFAYEYLVLIRG
ncbi:MAG: hypothetical protein A2176_15610 [Spirochaetes bacterium RBG_13_51_14]|nr:MAG: hypothetical protein A2176_15610 [Spirochaetes bacterium RBG_13_51_14]